MEKVWACAEKKPPVADFPLTGLKIYKGKQFPQAYRGGAFIAFHGSWNRAPGPQGGYNIVFQPLVGGKPSGDYIVFADGFAGGFKDPGKAAGALDFGEDIGARTLPLGSIQAREQRS
jgi:glucose/arabinose dehydrogenase